MIEVLTRPQLQKTKAATAIAETQQVPTFNEGDQLALEAAENLQTMLMVTRYGENGEPRELNNTHFKAADHLLCLLLAPNYHERDVKDPEQGDILTHLKRISSKLQSAADLMQERKIPPIDFAEQSALCAAAMHTADYANRLFAAYRGLPMTMETLRHLTTFAGTMPSSSRPQRPALHAEHNETRANELNRPQLVSVLDHIATSTTVLDDLLMQTMQASDIPGNVQNLIDAAILVIRGIGAIADEASGARVVGGMNKWHLGPNFNLLGNGGAA